MEGTRGKRKEERFRDLGLPFFTCDEDKSRSGTVDGAANVGESAPSPIPEMLRLVNVPGFGKAGLRGEVIQDAFEYRSFSAPVRPIDTLTVYCVALEGLAA